MDKIIKFQADGIAFSDYQIQEVVDSFFNDKVDTVLVTSTHLIISKVRARVKEGRINYDEIRIFVDGEEWNFDKDGRSWDWKPSQNVWENIISRLL